MKRTRRAKSGRGGHESAGMSLFPFLAVLMCTMGALIVLLVAINRQARLQAAEAAEAVESQSDQAKEDLIAARELVQLQISQLSASRQQTESQLADARLRLGHVEDHARRLRDELARLEAAWADLEKLSSDGGRRRSELQAELERLEAALLDARRLLAEAQQSAGSRRESYAVVPYEGPNQTHRRPIYLECRKDAVVLQPEGIEFSPGDFDGPLGPGNPLDVALRAAREYWLSNKAVDPQGSGEPYPLLLVRPDGIEAYYVARAAMRTWGAEFGYELIGENWELAFQQSPDHNLAKVVHSAIDSARIRQQRLAEAAPSHFNGSAGAARPVYRAAPFRGGVVLDEGGAPAPGSGYRSQRGAEAFARRFGEGSGDRRNSDGGSAGTQATSPIAGEGTAARRPGEWVPQASSAGGKEDGNASTNPADSSSVRPLAETRGRDWGLPAAAERSVPITRPIRVDLRQDRLVLVPERGLGPEKRIELGPATVDAVDEFVSAIWTHIDSWGIAGRGMYWKPTLKVRVAPGAEQRYHDLKTLLDGSGIELSQ